MVKYERYSKSNRVPIITLLAEIFAVAAVCAQIGNPPLRVTIVEGQQFAHQIQLPSRFQLSNLGRSEVPFDHYAFRVPSSSPDVLLLAACKFDAVDEHKFQPDVEICSPNAFAVDMARSYAVREVGAPEWKQAIPIVGFLEMNDPYRRTLTEQYKKPLDLRPQPIGPDVRNAIYEGYKYRGKTYLRRGDWITTLGFGDSADGKVVALAGADKRTLPKPTGVFSNDPVAGTSFGTFTLDIFDTTTDRRLVAADVKCNMNVILGLRHASLVNSRWFVISRDGSLQNMVLFDFKPTQGAKQ